MAYIGLVSPFSCDAFLGSVKLGFEVSNTVVQTSEANMALPLARKRKGELLEMMEDQMARMLLQPLRALEGRLRSRLGGSKLLGR